jgi:hypothetical protein
MDGPYLIFLKLLNLAVTILKLWFWVLRTAGAAMKTDSNREERRNTVRAGSRGG